MKTVQEWLRELDTEELIDSYFAPKDAAQGDG